MLDQHLEMNRPINPMPEKFWWWGWRLCNAWRI